MSDNSSPEPSILAEASTPNNVFNTRSGGVDINARGDVNIGGDVVEGDKIIYEAPAPIAPSLHQLPPPPRDFTGRGAELAELMSKAETDGVTISGLQGMGGIGKTALALVLAERLKPHYPDAQFYLDLKGADKQPLSVTVALTHVIRAYLPTAKLPESEAELRGLYMSMLDNKRALLLMDNANDKTQIEPLIPPSSCFLLVTSRQHFALPGLFAKDLNTLPPNEACDLLLKIAPRIGNQVNTLAKLCGYLPLALRLAGSALAERRTITPADYVKRLEDAQTRLELLEASLSLSYDLVSEELQQAWCALAVFPDSFDLAAAAAVWDVAPEMAQDRLDELVCYSLVEWNEINARARLHDLARLFANHRLDDAARLENQRRYAVHYGSVAATASTLYLQGGEQLMQGLALFDLEWPNIQSGHAWSVQFAEQDTQALSLCSDYAAQCDDILPLRQHPRERIHWLEIALYAAQKLARKRLEGAHLNDLGSAHQYLREFHRAIEYHKQSLAISRELGSRRSEAYYLSSLANAYRGLGEYHRAIEHHEQALVIAREIGDQGSEMFPLSGLGGAYVSLGEYRRAIEYFDESLAIAREIGSRRTESQDLYNIGHIYRKLGEYDHAIEHCEQALAIAREMGDQRSERFSLGELGNAYASLGEYDRAIEYFELSLAVAREIGDRRYESHDLCGLGNVYRNLGEHHHAIEYYEQSLAIAREIGDRRYESQVLRVLGKAHCSLGEYRHAIEYCEQSLAIARKIGDRPGEGNALNNLAEYFDAINDRSQASTYAQAALDIFTSIESPNAQRVRSLLAKLEQTEH